MFLRFLYRRYHFLPVFACTLLASAGLFIFVYVYRFALDQPFNWKAYREYLLNQAIGTVATALFYYFSLNEFQRLFRIKERFLNFLSPVILCLVSVEIYNLVVDRLLPLSSNLRDPISLEQQLSGHFLVGIFCTATAILIAYINHLRDLRKESKLLEEQKLKLEIEKMQTELKFLRTQINPHFLHNTLNSFYARSLPFSRELADSILTLSEMMRYALEETNTADGKVLLKDEIEHVRKVIKLNQFRFRNRLPIQMEVTGALDGYTITPFIIITLVENIFKHGDLSHNLSPVRILIDIDNGKLRYYSENKKKTGPTGLSTGIGLDNLQKRLQITYADEYYVNIKDQGDLYCIEVIINQL
jgi:two-component system, LytTR family, sensor kinase